MNQLTSVQKTLTIIVHYSSFLRESYQIYILLSTAKKLALRVLGSETLKTEKKNLELNPSTSKMSPASAHNINHTDTAKACIA